MNENKPKIEKTDKCMDCDTQTTLIEVSACPDYHLYGIVCCFKYVCKDYCTYICSQCDTTNKISQKDVRHNDNYYDGYKCYNCKTVNEIKTIYYGNLKEMCDRYCGNDCIPDRIILHGLNFAN